MVALVVLIVLGVWLAWEWVLYMWGASIAQGKGRSRALGWWAVFFGLFAIVVLYLLPDQSGVQQYVSASSPTPASRPVSQQLERLAALRDKGALTEEEFEKAKREALGV